MASGAVARVTAVRQTEEVVVDLGARSYPVVVGAGVLDGVGERLAARGFRGRAALVTSERVGKLYGARVGGALRRAGLEPIVVEMPDGEEHKSMAWMARIQDRLLEAGLDRHSPVVGLGGGVLTDVAGFAAATLLRGLPTALLPTTLVGQVDAAIGGKTGVNHARGKNLIGLFHQPRLVIADVTTLDTLPERELRAGLAEVIKYGVIGDAALFARLERDPKAPLGDPEALVAMVAGCCRQKAAVVTADEREETGARAVLNFGHTVAHGLEALTDYREWLHGEAVAMGMVAAARVSRELGRCGAETVGRIEGTLKRAGLPTDIPKGITGPALAQAIRSDKKSAGGKIRFVVVEDIGRTGFVELSSEEIVSRL